MASRWRNEDALRSVLRCQAGYYAVSGALPFVSMRLFEKITGPKTDKWLVQTVGMLTLSAAGGLYMGAQSTGDLAEETVFLSSAFALSFGAIDLYYGIRRKISPIYLVDAALELVFLGTVLNSM